MYFSILISSVLLLSWKFVSFKRLQYYTIFFNSFMCTLSKWLSYVKFHVCHITVLSNIQVWHSCGKTTSYFMFIVSWVIRSYSRSRVLSEYQSPYSNLNLWSTCTDAFFHASMSYYQHTIFQPERYLWAWYEFLRMAACSACVWYEYIQPKLGWWW